jgi:hypothetical protein
MPEGDGARTKRRVEEKAMELEMEMNGSAVVRSTRRKRDKDPAKYDAEGELLRSHCFASQC